MSNNTLHSQPGSVSFNIAQRFSLGDSLGLLSSMILLFALYKMAWVTSGATSGDTAVLGIEWLRNPSIALGDPLQGVMAPGGVTTLVFVVMSGALGIICALISLLFPSVRQMMIAVLIAAGVLGSLFYVNFFYNSLASSISDSGIFNFVDWIKGFFSILGAMRLGFWVGFLANIGLFVQARIPRPGVIISRREEGLVNNTLRAVVIIFALAFALFPVLFILSSAINPAGQLSTQGMLPRAVETPSDLIVNFRGLLYDDLEIFPFWNWLANSFIVATITTILTVFITAISAYSFSRFRFTGRRSLLLAVLLIQVFPNILALVAIFLILQQIGQMAESIPLAMPFLSFMDWSWLELFALNSLGGVILVYMSGAMGINTWLMKGFFDSIPRDIDESALVDGATHWQIFRLLIFPLVRPIIAIVAVLSFVGTFNEFVMASILLRDKEKWTLMVGLWNFINAEFDRDWGKFAAGALVSALPVTLVYIALQDQIVGGLTAGAVKG